jgi:hypothetical protein
LLNDAGTLLDAQSAASHFAQSITGKETVAPSKEEGLDDLLPELV